MSTKPIVQKLFLKSGVAYFHNPPEGYFEIIGDIPKEVEIVDQLRDDLDFIQIFIKNRRELEEILPKVNKSIKPDGKLWVTYYKGSSKIKTDVNRDSINNYAATLNLKGIFIISIDSNWSALRLKKE